MFTRGHTNLNIMQTRRQRVKHSVYTYSLNPIPEKKRKKCDQVEKVAKHDSKLLDLAFVMDCTGSMVSYIEGVRNNIDKIVEEIVVTEKSDVRLALIEYRDHPPQDTSFVTRLHDFTPFPKTMKDWLSQCAASGGGDTPEAVVDALHDVLKLKWREEATKMCVCVSDAPPHGLGIGCDSFLSSRTAGIDPVKMIAKKGITVYLVGCESSIRRYSDFYMTVVYETGGQYVPLTKAQLLPGVIVGGVKEELSLQALMAEVDAEIQQKVAAGREVDAKAMIDMLHKRFRSREEQVHQLRRNNMELTSVTSWQIPKKFSNMRNLCGEMRSSYKANRPSQSMSSRILGFIGSLFGYGDASAALPPWDDGFSAPALSSAPEASDSYACVKTVVTHAQSSRLVQKSIARNLHSKKK